MLHILAIYKKVRRYSDTWNHRRRMNNVLTQTIELTAGENDGQVNACVHAYRYVYVMCASWGETACVRACMHTAALFLVSPCMNICSSM